MGYNNGFDKKVRYRSYSSRKRMPSKRKSLLVQGFFCLFFLLMLIMFSYLNSFIGLDVFDFSDFLSDGRGIIAFWGMLIMFIVMLIGFFVTLFTDEKDLRMQKSPVVIGPDENVVGGIPHVFIMMNSIIYNLYFTERRLVFAFLIFNRRYNKHTFPGFEEDVERLTDDVQALVDDSDYNFVISYSDINRVVVTKRGFKIYFNEYVNGVLKRRCHSVVLVRVGFNSEKRSISSYSDLLYRYFSSVIVDKKNYLNRY